MESNRGTVRAVVLVAFLAAFATVAIGAALAQTVPAQPDFDWSESVSCQNAYVHFADGSPNKVGNRTWAWGDGTPDGTGLHPIHLFDTPGTHTVVLSGTNTTLTRQRNIQQFDWKRECCVALALPADVLVSAFQEVRMPLAGVSPTNVDVRYLAGGMPTGARIDRDNTFNWTVPNAEGAYRFTVEADGDRCRESATVVFHVTGIGQAPQQVRECADNDHDGVCDYADNCPSVVNYDQRDQDGDEAGDACDPHPCTPGDDRVTASQKRQDCAKAPPPPPSSTGPPKDRDKDGVPDTADICPAIPDPDQKDTDGDGFGDECDLDLDGDNVQDKAPGDAAAFLDNCPRMPNPDQRDTDHDGEGDACDADPSNPNNRPATHAPVTSGVKSSSSGPTGTTSTTGGHTSPGAAVGAMVAVLAACVVGTRRGR